MTVERVEFAGIPLMRMVPFLFKLILVTDESTLQNRRGFNLTSPSVCGVTIKLPVESFPPGAHKTTKAQGAASLKNALYASLEPGIESDLIIKSCVA